MTSKVKSNDNTHSNGASTAECDLVPMGSTTPGMSPQTQKGTKPSPFSSSACAAQGLIPISHKDFNEFIKGKGFT